MRPMALLLSASLLAGSGWGLNASAMEPMGVGTSTATAEQPVAAEQNHLQAASSQLRSGASRNGDLPMEFSKPAGPQAHPLLNLNF